MENNPHHWLATDILQIHHFQYHFFQNRIIKTNTEEQFRIYTLFTTNFFRHNFQLVWDPKFQTLCVIFPSKFTQDELLLFFALPDNRQPQFYNLLDFPTTHLTYLTYDKHSLDKSLNLPPPVRPYSKQNYLPPCFDTTSDVSLQTNPSSSNVLINTHSIDNPIPNLDPPPPPAINHVIITQPSTSQSPNQYNTPHNTPPLNIPTTTQPPVSQIPTTLPPIPLPFNNTINTQPTENLINLPPSNLNPPPTSYNPYESTSIPTASFSFSNDSFCSFCAFSDPIKLFDGLDHTYLPEKILAHISARVTFQFGPQLPDIQSYLT